MNTYKQPWREVMFAADCDPNGEGWCRLMDVDVAECDCLGPTQDGVEYMEVGETLYGRWDNNTQDSR